MKKLLLTLGLWAWTATAFCQTNIAARFAGEYFGVASPLRWGTNADERAVIDLFVYTDGSVVCDVYDYDLTHLSSAYGSVSARGRFILVIDETSYPITGIISAAGIATGRSTGNGATYVFQLKRRYKLPYEPPF